MDKTTITKADTLPITVQELELWCRIDDATEEQALLETLIEAARDTAENFTGRVLTPTTVEYRFDRNQPRYTIPESPVRSITKVEAETDADGLTLLIEGQDYKKRITDYLTHLRLLTGRSEPTIVVTANVGYVDVDAIPKAIKQAIAIHAASAYRGREGQDEAQETFERLLQPYRLELL